MAPFSETPISTLYSHNRIQVSKEPDLLDGWWTSEYLYALEGRAIFSKTWVCIAHRSRFVKAGDYISLELAGLPILIIRGKDNITRAFHNVCRHRAYTITKKPAGSSLVLGCRYHGWSYDTKGSLVKAPQFDGLEGFNKAENGLFKINTCTDRAGFIHVNLDASCVEYAPDCETHVSFSADHRISSSSIWLAGWDLDGLFNWKTPGANAYIDIGKLAPRTSNGFIQDWILSPFRRQRLNITDSQALHITPITTVLTFPHSPIWATITTLPISSGKCTVKCDIYSSSANTTLHAKDEELLRSCLTSYVRNLEERYNADNTARPIGQPPYLPLLKAHIRLERSTGTKIFPGRREEGKSESFCRAEKVCKELDAIEKGKRVGRVDSMQEGLEW